MKNFVVYMAFLFLIIGGCGKEEKPGKSEKCDLIPDPGLCKAHFPRYYFDKTEGKCKEFIWGGCDGVVPFNTLEECEQCGCGQSTND